MKVIAHLLIFLLVCASVAHADMVDYSDSIPLAKTNWSGVISVPKFNPTLGILQSIEFELQGHVGGSAKFESLDAGPTTVTMTLKAEIELHRPDNSTIVVSNPTATVGDSVLAYDGTIDFMGDSGRTFDSMSGDATEIITSPPPASDLALFTGFGNINLPIMATGKSTGSGSANLVMLFNTKASADVIVRYIYEVPEPAAISLLALGALPMLGRRRR